METLTEKFEKYVNENHQYGVWKTYIEIEEITGIDIHDVINEIDASYNFCRNSSNQFTTRKLYSKYVPFCQKLRDSFAGRLL